MADDPEAVGWVCGRWVLPRGTRPSNVGGGGRWRSTRSVPAVRCEKWCSLDGGDAVRVALLAEHHRERVDVTIAVTGEEGERRAVIVLRDLWPLDVVPSGAAVVNVVRDRPEGRDSGLRPREPVERPRVPAAGNP